MPLSTHPQQYCGTVSLVLKQVPRGHNIIADGWAGASNSNPYPMPPHIPRNNHKSSFLHFSTDAHERNDRLSDGQSLL